MFGGILLFDEEFIHVVTITFTSLILTELLMVALTIRTWHWLMVAAEVFSLAVYIATLAVFKDYFGKSTKQSSTVLKDLKRTAHISFFTGKK